jgi:hypothetical protein
MNILRSTPKVSDGHWRTLLVVAGALPGSLVVMLWTSSTFAYLALLFTMAGLISWVHGTRSRSRGAQQK